MGTLQFKNNASTTLSGSINNTQTVITVVSGSGFPVLAAGDYFYATMYELSHTTEINIEIVKVTEVIGNNWTIVRAQDGTTARARNGIEVCYIEQRMTAASAQLMLQSDNNLSDLQNPGTARTNLGLGSLATQNANAVAITGGTIGGVAITGIDSTTTIADNADPTKKVAFEVSGVTTGNTRTLTVPNASGTIALLANLTEGYQPLNSNLTALAGLSANGLIARTGAGIVNVRIMTAPEAGLTVSNGDGVSGNPTLSLANDLAAVEGIATTGFVRRTGTDTWSASAIADGDLPSALTGKTYNALTLAANATGFVLSGGVASKTLTINNSVTLAGTDGTTITLPATTGTVALNNQTMFIGTTGVAINRASGSLSLTGVNIDGAAGSAATAATATKATNLVGGNNTTLLGAIGYQSNTDTTTLLSPNVTTTKQFLSQTGTGANGAAPVWSAVGKSDVGLGNVENTALSTWAGSANITTLGTVASGTWNATTISIAKGGTGATTQTAGFNALAPTTTLGDLIYSDGTNNVRLAGNTTATRRFLRQTGTGSASAAPAWDTLTDPDIPSALTGKTYNGLTLVAAGTGFTVAGGATSKTLAVNNTLTFSGTDGSTLNIGAGGTLGSAAYTASTAYAPAAGSASVTTLGTITSGTWAGSTIGISYGGTGATSKIAAFDALSPAITLGDLIYSDGTDNVRLAGNTSTAKRFLTQTGTGTVSAAPGWNAIVDGDLPSALTGKTYNGLTLTANATGFQVAGGATAKTLAVSNNLTLAGTDGSTLNISNGGTLNSAAFLSSLYASSNNLGLGVTPSAWGSTYRALEVRTSAVYDDFGTSGGLTFNAFHNGSNWIYKGTGGDASALRYEQSASSHRWLTASSGTGGNTITFTQAMMLDLSNNLGLGVTPSAWSGFSAVLQQRGGGHVVGDTGAFMQVGANNYYNGSNWIYTTSAPASRFTQNNGIFQWFTAPSGTAGNAITFTQAMTLDSSNNLGLGVTPSGHVPTGYGGPLLQIANAGILGAVDSAGYGHNAYYANGFYRYIASSKPATLLAQESGAYKFFTAPSGTADSAISFTQAMDLANSGGASTLTVNSATNTASAVRLTTNGGLTAGMFLANPTVDHSLGFQTAGTTRMLLDASGNLGLGVTPSAWSIIKAIEIGGFRNSVFSDNGSVSVGIASGSYYNSGWKYAVTGSTVGYYEVAGNAHRWFSAPSGTAGNAISFTQAMTLDSSKLEVVGTGKFNSIEIGANNSDINNANLNAIAFKIQGTERMRLETSGNFGLGVVPSAWRSSEKAIDIAGGAAISGIANEARIYANAFVDSTPEFKYKESAAASFYNQSAGNHDWYSAPTGTAGSTATFTNVMSVTGANGNLSLHVPGARIVGEFSNATPSLRLSFQSKTTNGHTAVPAIPNGTATAAYFIAHNAATPDSSGYFYLGATASEAVLRSDRSGTADYLPITFYTGAVQRVKIDTAGRVGMGTASPNAHLDLQNINPELRIKSTGGDRASINIDAFASYGQSIVRFASNDAEQGRIYSAANEGAPVLVFATGSSASTRMRIDNNRVQLVSSGSRGATGYVLTTANESIANAQRASGYIQWDTDVGQIGTNYFLSDIRKKDNVAPANFDSSQLIDSIEFIEFDWKKDSGNQGHVKVGVSAQQLQTLDDKLANKLSDGSLMVCDPQLISYIGKALQEQIRLVKSLQSRIVDLERARG